MSVSFAKRQASKDPYPEKAKLLTSVPGNSLEDARIISELASPWSALDYNVPANKKPVFPKDHGRHYDVQSDWYFFVCHLYEVNNKNNHYGVLVLMKGISVMGQRLLKKGESLEDVAVEIAQLNITSGPDNKFFGGKEIIVPATQTKQSVNPFYFETTENFKMQSTDKSGNPWPMFIKATDPTQGTSIDVFVKQQKPVFLQGKKGFVGLGGVLGWGYYSYTDLQVVGNLTVNGRQVNVTGKGWFDHQWGTVGTPHSKLLRTIEYYSSVFHKSKAFAGWGWFAVQLDNNIEYTTSFLNMFNTDGTIGNIKQKHKAFYGKYHYPDGTTKFVTEGVSVTVTKTITDSTGAEYPTEWLIEEKSQKLKVVMTAFVENQIATRGDGSTYAENATVISGTMNGKAVKGVGWGENVGVETQQKLFSTQLKHASINPTTENITTLVEADHKVNRKRGIVALSVSILLLVLIIATPVTVHTIRKKNFNI